MGDNNLLKKLRDSGLELFVSQEGGLRVTPASLLTDELRLLIRQQRDVLLAALREEVSRDRWLLHRADSEPVEVTFAPAATLADVLGWHSRVIAAEPIELQQSRPVAPAAAVRAGTARSTVTVWALLLLA